MAVPIDSHDEREAAFVRLAEERLDGSYRVAYALLGDRAAAEDATHDALVRAWSAFPRLRDPGAFDGWFRRILVNACRDIRQDRRARPSEPLEAALPVVGRDPDPAIAWAERDALLRAIRLLRPEHREVVVLRYVADLPLAEVGTTLGLPLGTVKSRLHHALTYLRAEYDAAARPGREVPR
ncbi:MAG: sigma-70 family RNA polymerase sigma factor [Chloroflexota bacterium]